MRRDWSALQGVVLTPAAVFADERGSFTKMYDGAALGVVTTTQVCVSSNHLRGTVRGMHVQVPPHPETKRLWCAAGEVWDVLVDLRPDEPTHGDWAAIHLTAEAPAMVTVPPGVAHGFQTLTDDASLVYLIDGEFAPDAARTLRWDDPTVGIEWPHDATMISDNDRAGQLWPLS